ncbi:MAG TPA: DnaB-like helicase N-terminal domain-containing protein [Solirubrobacterales bacterium]|nr:DnaB-like helicase N-terminal domain-containing protein [Solirubrobacterales bacterium]
MTDVQVPPQNIEAEGSVLGAMLVAAPTLPRVIDDVKLDAPDFYLDKHRLIFAAIRDLYRASQPVDELSVADALKRRGKAEQAGGRHYLSELAAKVPSAANAQHYAEIVKREAVEAAKREVGRGLLNGLVPAEAIERLRELETPGAGASSLVSFSEIVARPVRFAWRDRLALGKITLLSGRPKIGKGLLYSHLLAEVTRGTLDGELDGPRRAIVVTTEDEPGDTLKPRLMAGGADLSLVSYFTMGSLDDPVPFRVPGDAAELSRRVAETDAALVVLDPLVEFLDGRLDANKSQGVRHALASLNGIAREHGCAVLAIAHLNKGLSKDALLRVEGSAAFTQIVRAGLMLGFDPSDPDEEEGSQRVLAVSSTNLSKVPPSLAYEISEAVVEGDGGEPIKTARIHLVGESAAVSHDLLGHREDDESRADHDEATEFLLAELEGGPKPASEIQRARHAAGIGPGALKRAKRQLGVKSTKAGMGGGWIWALPEHDAAELAIPFGDEPSPSSPSSPSGSGAKSEHPLRGRNAEGDDLSRTEALDVGDLAVGHPPHRADEWEFEGPE